MRREIVVQLVLTAIALILLLLVIFHPPTYVEQSPGGTTGPTADQTATIPATSPTPAPSATETVYSRPAPRRRTPRRR